MVALAFGLSSFCWSSSDLTSSEDTGTGLSSLEGTGAGLSSLDSASSGLSSSVGTDTGGDLTIPEMVGKLAI